VDVGKKGHLHAPASPRPDLVFWREGIHSPSWGLPAAVQGLNPDNLAGFNSSPRTAWSSRSSPLQVFKDIVLKNPE